MERKAREVAITNLVSVATYCNADAVNLKQSYMDSQA